MFERKWMDYTYSPRWHREDFNDEYNSIASKVAREWLLENKYEIYSFKEIIRKIRKVTDIRYKDLALKRFRKHAKSEIFLEHMKKTEEFLIGIFEEKFARAREYYKAIRKLRDEVKFEVGSDFIVKKDHEVFFVVTEVYQAEPKKYHEASCKIAKKHGFKTMALKLDVGIRVGEVSLTEL